MADHSLSPSGLDMKRTMLEGKSSGVGATKAPKPRRRSWLERATASTRAYLALHTPSFIQKKASFSYASSVSRKKSKRLKPVAMKRKMYTKFIRHQK